jgi:hypothetical protein
MRQKIVVLLVFVSALIFPAQAQRTNPGKPCGDQSFSLPDYYDEAVMEHLKRPNVRSLVSITVGTGDKIILETDGTKFRLWTGIPDIPENNVNEFLFKLDDLCKLPTDPSDAAAMIKMKWQQKQLSSAEFWELPRNFIAAASQYILEADRGTRSSVASGLETLHLDTDDYSIKYKNQSQYIELRVLYSTRPDPLLQWIDNLKKLANYESAKQASHNP